jgi:hypothetical protein
MPSTLLGATPEEFERVLGLPDGESRLQRLVEPSDRVLGVKMDVGVHALFDPGEASGTMRCVLVWLDIRDNSLSFVDTNWCPNTLEEYAILFGLPRDLSPYAEDQINRDAYVFRVEGAGQAAIWVYTCYDDSSGTEIVYTTDPVALRRWEGPDWEKSFPGWESLFPDWRKPPAARPGSSSDKP